MKIGITGASGHFGAAATRRLIEAGFPAGNLVLVTRSPERIAELGAMGAAVRAGDFDDAATLVKAFEGVTDLLMISGTRVGFREPQHRAAIDAAVQAGVKRIIYTSFIGAVAENPSMAVKDHVVTERMLRDCGLFWTVLRDAQYSEAVVEAMGPLALGTGRMVNVAGDGRMAFVSRDDCVASAVAVLLGEGHENKVYNITGPELVSYREVAAMLQSLDGRPLDFAVTDEDGLYAMFDAIGVPRQPVDDLTVSNFPWNSDDMVSFEVAVRDGHFAVISDDVERLTGRRPIALRDLLECRRADILNAADEIGKAASAGS